MCFGLVGSGELDFMDGGAEKRIQTTLMGTEWYLLILPEGDSDEGK